MTDNIAAIIEVTGTGMGWALTQDLITSQYVKTISDNATVSEVLEDLLAYQITSAVVLGGVSTTLDVPIAIDTDQIPLGDRNVWEACKLVRDIAGGYLYVDFDPDAPMTRRLWLMDRLGRNEGQQIRLGKNLAGVDHITDYLQSCNCLYPVGDSSLDIEKVYTRIDPAITTDASYAYITIQEQYSAYKDWTGEGDALPANITIEKPTGAWDSPTGNDNCGAWQNPENAYDDNLATFARWMPFVTGSVKTAWLQLTIPATDATQVEFPSWWTEGSLPGTRYPSYIEVEIYYSGAWHNIYADAPYRETQGEFVIASFSQQTITGVRIRYMNTADYYYWYTRVDVKEIYVWNSTGFSNDDAHWEQGENEKVLRCAIGDYVEGVGYVLSYTHAPYFIDLDDITDRDNIISRYQSFNTDDQDTLMALGRTRLAELPKVSAPSTTIDVRSVDLSGEEGMEFEELELGSTLRIIDEGLDIDENAVVVRIYRPDLTHPGQVTLELGIHVKDIIDVI